MTEHCAAVLANRRYCTKPPGHGGRHAWADLPGDQTPQQTARERAEADLRRAIDATKEGHA